MFLFCFMRIYYTYGAPQPLILCTRIQVTAVARQMTVTATRRLQLRVRSLEGYYLYPVHLLYNRN
jgi:hypothetical protein